MSLRTPSILRQAEAIPPLEALRAARRQLLDEFGACAANSPDLVLELAQRSMGDPSSPECPVEAALA